MLAAYIWQLPWTAQFIIAAVEPGRGWVLGQESAAFLRARNDRDRLRALHPARPARTDYAAAGWCDRQCGERLDLHAAQRDRERHSHARRAIGVFSWRDSDEPDDLAKNFRLRDDRCRMAHFALHRRPTERRDAQ